MKIWASVEGKPRPELHLYKAGLLGGSLQAGLLGKSGGLVCGLPGELRLGAAKVAVGGGLLIDGPAEIQALDDALGSECKVLADQFGQLGFAPLPVPKVSMRTLTGSATPMA